MNKKTRTTYIDTGYWSVEILGEHSDFYFFLLAEDAARFADKIESGERDPRYLKQQRDIDSKRMEEISNSLRDLIGEHNDIRK